MPTPTRTIAFIAAEAERARAASDAFAAASSRLGLNWSPKAYLVAGASGADFFKGMAAVVAVDLPEFTVPTPGIRLERIASAPNLEQAVSGLIARLLGGSDAPTTPKPPPAPPPKKVHTVKLSRETAGRRGKGVTIVSELPLTEDQLKELATRLKNACGTGGTAKDGRIEIQGDQRDRLAVELEKLGYKVKRAGG